MRKKILSCVVLSFGLLLPVLVAASTFDNIYILGDSLSDQGNLYAATFPGVLSCPSTNPQCQALSQANNGQGTGLPANDYYYNGRFSNGLNYADILAQKLGLTLNPSSSSDPKNFNFAYGGARTNYNRVENTAPVAQPGPFPQGARPWSLDLERQAFQSRNINDPNALFVVWSGSNDIADLITPYLLNQDVSAQLQNVANGIQSVISDFIAAGSRDILVPNIPDFGKVPLVPGFARAKASELTKTYNDKYLDPMLDTFTGIVNIHRVDIFSLMQDVADHPADYGFTNVTDACYSGFVDPDIAGTATVCSSPSTYAFWDGEHPTTAFHALLANVFYEAAVPEPSVLMNFLLGLGVLAAVGGTRYLRQHSTVEGVNLA